MAELFRFRWDPPTLACLDERPLRFRALTRRIGTCIGERIEDNALNRSLVRLRRAGLIAARSEPVGRRFVPIYYLTDKGRDRLTQYQALVLTYQTVVVPNAGHRVASPAAAA